MFLAEKCAKVIGIESVPDAIEAANENAVSSSRAGLRSSGEAFDVRKTISILDARVDGRWSLVTGVAMGFDCVAAAMSPGLVQVPAWHL